MRLISKLDCKPPYVVKPIHFEGLRKIGLPSDIAKKYYLDGIDEIFYLDIVASLYQREILFDEISKVSENIFVPFAVGGGIKSIDDMSRLFHSGADKVVINTHALQTDASIIDNAAKIFGSQAVVVNIEAKQIETGWHCYSDCGRIDSNKDVVSWASEVQDRGAGEILLQSVDRDGKKSGFDISLAHEVKDILKIHLVVASGAGSIDDIKKIIEVINPSGIAIASMLHYDLESISKIKLLLGKV